ncbi:MAG: Asp-tRNA(Asn)/Glu-tRNA(Gln) amidotransferase subunit GatC [Actinomycetota bacterium]|nr:MAG: Asp-tRNA(Asn)/Glu-tRNA(Gln) amidotransferase subunit GatC [Actinomycetota bacterium]
MSDSISRKEVNHVANLAKLSLSEEEELMYTDQLAAILDHARDIMALDTDDLSPTAHPLELRNVFRPDVEAASLSRDEVLSQAPASEDGRFLVPRILGEAP